MQKRFFGSFGALTCALLLASCVSQEQYDQATSLAEMWQDRLHDMEADMARVESENDRLRSEVRAREAGALASDYDDQVEIKMGELESLLNDLEGPVG
ncbi:MAG: hypothetical protein VCB99_02765, partial [Myxococcota bacterium]